MTTHEDLSRGSSTSSQPSGRLTVGEVADLTGVPAATLRSWERRFGFPSPLRSAGGQRRYGPEQVAQVQRVLGGRERGLSLAAAIAEVAEGATHQPSVFADLRAAHPTLDVMTVGVRVMRALTYAIEDECLALAVRPVVLGCFQTAAAFEASGRRWRELARRAERSVVLASFESTSTDSEPQRVALPSRSPLLNEWGLVCDDRELSVALVGWERPAPAGGERLFEAVVSMDPGVVRDAAARYAHAAGAAGIPEPHQLVPTGSTPDADGRRSMALLRRFAAYADS